MLLGFVIFLIKKCRNIIFSTHKHWGKVLNRGAQADAFGATQVLGRGGQVVSRDRCLSQVLGRSAQAVARGAVPCASQILDRGAGAVSRGAVRCASHVLDRGAQAGTKTVSCGVAALSH